MLKKKFYSAIFLCTFFLSFQKTIAQINISVGAKAGMNASWIGNNSTPQNTSSDGFLFGYTAGVWGRINLSDKEESGFFIQPELVISQMGSKSVTTNDANSYIIKNTNSTLFNLAELPVMAGYRINLGEDIDLRFYGGPSFARILNAKTKFRTESTPVGGGSSASSEKTLDITEDVKPYWTSLQLGVGANFNRFNVDLRFQRVMTAMYMNSTSDDSRAMAFQITLGYKIF